MLYAVVARPPVFGGKVKSVDAADALKVPGVVKVVADRARRRSRRSSSRSAASPWSRATPGRRCRAARRSRSCGTTARTPATTPTAYRAELEERGAQARQGRAQRRRRRRGAMASAAKRVEAEYYIPHLAHAPMEPPAATVRINDGKCEVWACVQAPQAARDRLAEAARPAGGERHRQRDAARRRLRPQVEARLRGRGRAPAAKAMDGAPVKVTWTREDDLHHGYYHTVSVEHLEAGLDAKGQAGRLAAPQRRADHRLDLRARPEARAAVRARHGPRQHAVRDPEHPHREPGGRGAYAHRLVPLGLEHPARLRGAVLRRRARAGGRTRSEGLPARADRPGAPRRPDGDRRRLEPRRGSRSAIRSTPAACGASSRPWREGTGWGRSCRRAAGSASPRTTAS